MSVASRLGSLLYRTRAMAAAPEPASAEYLAATLLPSNHVNDPSSSRKLLVLDLNGTLLYRPKRRLKFTPGELDVHLRPVRPRPYIPSFREYLFHPSNREWLDTMIWSSAQPHSVASMVGHCFPDVKNNFIGIWARDTFGLAKEEYGESDTNNQATIALTRCSSFSRKEDADYQRLN